MTSKPYDEERLGRLLALLRAAPGAWVERAKQVPFAQRELDELERMLEADPTFSKSFDTDPVAATQAAGLKDLSARLEQELQEFLSETQEVVAHRKQHEPVTNRLRTLLLRSRAVRERLGL
jgi:hypothetical protein